MDALIYTEHQRFRQPWLWGVLITAFLLAVGLATYQYFRGTADEVHEAFLTLLIVCFVFLLVGGLLWVIRLHTLIGAEGIRLRFFPFHERFYPWQEVASAYVREYNPIREFGGWGYRISLKDGGVAYNIRGRDAMQLVLKNGEKILIGTQKPAELGAALKQVFPEGVVQSKS